MSRRGDDEGFRPHPGDPWHPGWSSDAETTPEAETPEETAGARRPPAAPPAAPRRGRFGRGRRHRGHEEPAAPVGEEPVVEAEEASGWWAAGAPVDETVWETSAAASATAEEAEGVEEEAEGGEAGGEEAEASAPLFPWWTAAAPAEPPAAPALPVEPAPVPEVVPPPRREDRGLASVVPLDLPVPAVPPRAVPPPLVPVPVPTPEPIPPAGPEQLDFAAAVGEVGDEAPPEVPPSGGPSLADELERAAAALLAEMGGEPRVELLETEPLGVKPLEVGPLEVGPLEVEPVEAEETPAVVEIAEEAGADEVTWLRPGAVDESPVEPAVEPAVEGTVHATLEAIAGEAVLEAGFAALEVVEPEALPAEPLVEPVVEGTVHATLEAIAGEAVLEAGVAALEAGEPEALPAEPLVEPVVEEALRGAVEEAVAPEETLEWASEVTLEEAGVAALEADEPEAPAWVPPGLAAAGGLAPGAGEVEVLGADGFTTEEGLRPSLWTPELEEGLAEEAFGEEAPAEMTLAGEAGGLVLEAWDLPEEAPPAEPPAAAAARPAATAGRGAAEAAPDAEVEEWLAFVEGTPVPTRPAAAGELPTPEAAGWDQPAWDQEEESAGLGPEEASALPPEKAPRDRRGWFRRRKRAADRVEEGIPEPGSAGEEADEEAGEEAGAAMGEAAPQPPPWPADAALPAVEAAVPEEAVEALDDEAEAEAAWREWEAGAEGALEAPAAPPPVVEPEVTPASWERGEGPAQVRPIGAAEAPAWEEGEEPQWEEAEWGGEPELVPAGGYGDVDEDTVEVPAAGLPEEDLEAEGWEPFPEPGRPVPRIASAVSWTEPPPAVVAPAEPPPEAAGWETFPEPGTRPPRLPLGSAEEPDHQASGWGEQVEEPPAAAEEFDAAGWEEEPAEAGAYPEEEPPAPPPRRRVDEPTEEMAAPDLFDFARPERQEPISEEYLAGAVTMEHRDLAQEVARADTAETELQALSAPMPGLESGVVGFEDVAHLGEGEEMVIPRRSDLPVRVATGMVLAAMLLGSLWVGGEFLAGFVGLMVMVGLGELYGTLRRHGYQPLALFGFLGAIGLLVGTWFYGPVAIPVAVVSATILTFFYYAFAPHRRDALTNGGLAILGMLWVTGTGAFAFPIAASPDFRVLVLAVAAAVVATDVGAFFAGRAWGRRLMSPVLSPHKTWEGLAGGVILGIGAAVAMGYFFDEIGIQAGALLGVVVAVMAPLGDLAESMVKRSLGVKDMGSLLPGHGGILDRIDAFLFVLPAAWVLFETLGLLR